MKLKSLALFPLAACAILSCAAQAEIITFKGKVVGSACIPKVSGSSNADGTVILPPVTKSMFPNQGNTTGSQSFSISLSGCADANGLKMKAYFWQPTAQAGRVRKESGTGNG